MGTPIDIGDMYRQQTKTLEHLAAMQGQMVKTQEQLIATLQLCQLLERDVKALEARVFDLERKPNPFDKF